MVRPKSEGRRFVDLLILSFNQQSYHWNDGEPWDFYSENPVFQGKIPAVTPVLHLIIGVQTAGGLSGLKWKTRRQAPELC
ncbi:hypothetical protein TNIN_194721 [Trichonephila inaurata madagascariensis]|uniref:Uncharacterized protein n=1 Tax=Trichonephila inaurata madagascariensis TaxID=2747483 RepID=A0A8X6Y135_9ARAC|nr:hypothetical protein TNIN_194721 [Trichonephila inaurata madagascariensis]